MQNEIVRCLEIQISKTIEKKLNNKHKIQNGS